MESASAEFADLLVNFIYLATRLAIDQSICILTRPVVITGQLVVNWLIEKNMVNVKILSISYLILLDSRNRLEIVSI